MPVIKLFFALILTVILSSSAHAQEQKDKKEWEANISAGASLKSGNSDTSLFSLGSRVEKFEGADQWRFRFDAKRGESDGTKDVQDLNFEAQYRRVVSEKNFFAFEEQIQHDDIANLDYRFSNTLTAGHFFYKKDESRFSVEAGPGFVAEKQGSDKDQYATFVIAERLNISLSDTAKIVQFIKGTVSLEDATNSLIETEVALETDVVGSLALKLSVNSRFDNEPADGKEEHDLTVIAALQYNFS